MNVNKIGKLIALAALAGFLCFIGFRGTPSVKSAKIQVYSFEKLSPEKLSNRISRRYINNDKKMLTRFDFKRGAVISKYQHKDEQITYILKGAARITIANEEFVVRSGEMIVIPAHTPHLFEALEETIEIDVSNTPRRDWTSEID